MSLLYLQHQRKQESRRIEEERRQREEAERQAKRAKRAQDALVRAQPKKKDSLPNSHQESVAMEASPLVANAGYPKTVKWGLSQESPASSVSLSQSLEKQPRSYSRKPVARMRITYDDKDSSSDEEDLVAIARELVAKKRQREEAKEKKAAEVKSAVAAAVTSAAAAASSSSKYHAWDDHDDDDESDCDLVAVSRDLMAKNKTIKAVETGPSRSSTSPPTTPPAKRKASVSSSKSDHDDDDETNSSTRRRRARNPLALMEEERALARQALFSKPISRSDSDDLWDDDGLEDVVSPSLRIPSSAEKTPSSGRKRPRKPKEANEPGKEDDPAKNVDRSTKSPRTPPGAQKKKKREVAALKDDLEEEEDALHHLHELKPDFPNPKFGPYDFEPLPLGKGVHEVPASINRYIQNYQQVGIKFMYQKAIMTGKGAILGDEMGLGKTIQIAGLLAALLEKKGNGQDALELRRRSRLAEQHAVKVQREREAAMLAGNFIDNFDYQSPNMNLPTWAPVLILVPSSVIDNWMKELATWGDFSVQVYKGSSRESILEKVRQGTVEVMILSHDRFGNDVKELLVVDWKLVVVDEFHLAKNAKTWIAKGLRLLRDTVKCAVVGLTGTLIQNKHVELWNLVDIVSKDYLGSWTEFKADFADPIKLSLSTDSDKAAVERGKHASAILSLKLKRDLFLARKKLDVLKDDLPEKHQFIVFCDPSPLQKKLYRHILELPDFVQLKQARGPCDCGVNQQFFREFRQLRTKEEKIEYQRRRKDELVLRKDCCYTIPKDPMAAVLWRQMHTDNEQCKRCPFCIGLPAFTILNKLSSHAALLQAHHPPDRFGVGSADQKAAEKGLERAKAFIPARLLPQLPGGSYVREGSIMDDHGALSGKMKVLDKLLNRIITKGGRTLLFSASVQALDLIQNYVRAAGFSHLRMDGGTAPSKRQELVDQFNNDPTLAMFLLSTKAMGVGLNITGANYVIIFDVEWNPSWEEQAAGRAYRIGQTKDVRVYRLISTGTIEEMKYQRQVYKNTLKDETLKDMSDVSRANATRVFRGVADDKTRRGELFGTANLLKLKDGTFMDYGIDATDSRNFGGIMVQRVEALQNRLANVPEPELGGDEDVEMLDELEGFASKDVPDNYEEEEYDDNGLGGESQVNLDIYENVGEMDGDEGSEGTNGASDKREMVETQPPPGQANPDFSHYHGSDARSMPPPRSMKHMHDD